MQKNPKTGYLKMTKRTQLQLEIGNLKSAMFCRLAHSGRTFASFRKRLASFCIPLAAPKIPQNGAFATSGFRRNTENLLFYLLSRKTNVLISREKRLDRSGRPESYNRSSIPDCERPPKPEAAEE